MPPVRRADRVAEDRHRRAAHVLVPTLPVAARLTELRGSHSLTTRSSRRAHLPRTLDRRRHLIHTMCMKRTNVVLDESLLEEAVRVSGERTYSAAINRALKDFVSREKARRILTLAGSGLWQGDLSIVREDAPAYGPKKGRRGPR